MGRRKTKYPTQACLFAGGFQKWHESNPSVHFVSKKTKDTRINTLQAETEKQQPGDQPTTLHASPTAALNVRKLCGGECCSKGHSMEMTQLTLCFASTELEEMKPSSQNPDVYSVLYQHHCFKCWHSLQRRPRPAQTF